MGVRRVACGVRRAACGGNDGNDGGSGVADLWRLAYLPWRVVVLSKGVFSMRRKALLVDGASWRHGAVGGGSGLSTQKQAGLNCNWRAPAGGHAGANV